MKFYIVKVSGYIDRENLDEKITLEINKLIKDGWELNGNMLIMPNCSKVNPSFVEIWQPMILK